MKRLVSVLGFLLLLGTGHVSAQQYNTGLGLRLSPFWGVTVKHFISNTDAVEGILHSRWNAFKLTGLWERHAQAFDEPGLYFYYGGGAHIGAATGRYYNDRFYDTGRMVLGLDGIIGLEYTLQDPSIPIGASLDWKPAFEFSPFAGFWGGEIAISVRYLFK